jgi:hypothetical protein
MDQKQPEFPCNICLVRPCCSETCNMVKDYMISVLELVCDNPNHEVLKQFSELQVEQIRSCAVMLKRNKDDVKQKPM